MKAMLVLGVCVCEGGAVGGGGGGGGLRVFERAKPCHLTVND